MKFHSTSFSCIPHQSLRGIGESRRFFCPFFARYREAGEEARNFYKLFIFPREMASIFPTRPASSENLKSWVLSFQLFGGGKMKIKKLLENFSKLESTLQVSLLRLDTGIIGEGVGA